MQLPIDLLSRVARIPPGADLAAALGGLDLAGVPNDRVVDVLQAQYRQLAHDQARMLATIVEVSRSTPFSDPDDPDVQKACGPRRALAAYEWASGELAAALTFTGRAAELELHFAQTVVEKLPWVFAALLAGQIDRVKAKVFADHLDPAFDELTTEQIDAICADLLPIAPTLTTGQLAARLLRAIIAIDPAYARRRYARAVRERAVTAYLDRDHTVTITATGLPVDEAAAACERLEVLAAAVKRAGHPGRLGQIQTDLFLGMLDGRFQGMTETQIITYLLTHPRTEDTPAAAATPAAQGRPAAMGADTAASETTRTHDSTDTGSIGETIGVTTEPAAGVAAEVAATGSGTRATSTGTDPIAGAADTSSASCPGAGSDPTCVPAPDHGVAQDPMTNPGAADGPRWTRAGIEIRVGLSTLLGLDDQPGEIPGLGPVLADVARTIVARQRRGAPWRFAVTDAEGYLILAGVTRRRPHLGAVPESDRDRCRGGVVEVHIPAALLDQLHTDPTRSEVWAEVINDIAAQYSRRHELTAALDARPTDRFARAALARHVEVRDRTCSHPGCRRSARKSDLDHTRDHARGGPSVRRNIGPNCARHHLYKHRLGWRLHQPKPGHFVWTSPLGQVYRTRGEPVTPPQPEPRPRPLEPQDDPDDRHVYVDQKILHLPPPQTTPQPSPSHTDSDDEPPF
ncbi:MAG: HNH endonuclease signature motif containing protein [Pseudonocardia sp.]